MCAILNLIRDIALVDTQDNIEWTDLYTNMKSWHYFIDSPLNTFHHSNSVGVGEK